MEKESQDLTDKEQVILSKEALIKNFNIDSGKYLYWTDDVNVELPIII